MRSVLPKAQLLTRKCRAINGESAYSAGETLAQLSEIAGWSQHGKSIERCFAFRDFYDTMAFVNALAWLIHREDHHPDVIMSYNRCTIRWSTHSVDGLSENDFICAAKTDAVFGRSGN
jgi:4a-hydroxytetrahydrobiopterin dehydratase